MDGSSLQVIFVDVLFLCLAGGLALWFRAWLREQQKAMDRRIEALETQQQGLARLCERLASTCRSLERVVPGPDSLPRPARSERVERPAAAPSPTTIHVPPTGAARAPAEPEPTPRSPSTALPGRRRVDTPAAQADRQWEELTDRSREAYRRARELLEQGMSPTDIARRVGLGVAEVNVLKRMRDAGRR